MCAPKVECSGQYWMRASKVERSDYLYGTHISIDFNLFVRRSRDLNKQSSSMP